MNNYIPTVIEAIYVKDYTIEVEFDNGTKRTVDCSPYIKEGPIFEPLKDKEYFKHFFVDGCTVSWPNGADIAPETLYGENIP
ncbi:DUF2442 domain-containing protein [Deltaproteobacteria bacterium TL4]